MGSARLDYIKIDSFKILSFDVTNDATNDNSNIKIFNNNKHYDYTDFDFTCEGEWFFEKKEEVKNRFSFLDLDE